MRRYFLLLLCSFSLFSQIRESQALDIPNSLKELDSSFLKVEDYIGDFYSEELDTSYWIFLEGEKLNVKIAQCDIQELHLYDIDTFASYNNLLLFKRSNGVIKGFELDVGRATNFKFEKK